MIVKSILDTDFYKLSMQNFVLHNYSNVRVEYQFFCRNKEVDLTPYKEEIKKEVEALYDLRVTDDESDFLYTLENLTEDYIDFLRNYRFNRRHVTISEKEGKLHISVAGSWLQTIPWEIPLLSIVNEVYFRNNYPDPDYAEGERRLELKIKLIKDVPNFLFADFGTRRRFSADWQEHVVSTFAKTVPNNLVGTSNVLLAKKLGIKPIGTNAHELYMVPAALHGFKDVQKQVLYEWIRSFPKLGVALSDTYTFNSFLKDFTDSWLLNMYSGVRHDSGSPYDWGENLIAHYEKHNIDPKTKTAVFSDGLTVESAVAILKHFENRIKVLFGIGTSLTNDMGYDTLSIVIKAVEAMGVPLVKLSDEPAKAMCLDPKILQNVKEMNGVG